VKSLAGEQTTEARVDQSGIAGDRQILVRNGRGRVVTSGTHHRLLGLKGTLDSQGGARISGYPRDSPEALYLVKQSAGPDAALLKSEGGERFDVLRLLIATDGAIAHMGFDRRRLRPDLVFGGVELEMRSSTWPNSAAAVS
jgi:hypothetical protein